ncbi:MAG TPA: hypothetical protein VJ508_20940, partial [Saprospiraceae bacterium]|nr:hypothetical protein [Saprospiraceae bacterium]
LSLPSPSAFAAENRPSYRARLPCTAGRNYMLNGQFAYLTPLSRIDQPGFAWRTKSHTNNKGITEVIL